MKRGVGWGLVAIQFALLILLALAPQGTLWPRSEWVTVLAALLLVGAISLAVAAGIQLGRNLTPNPIPRNDGELVTSGVYRLVRHPIYTALAAVGLGLTLWGASQIHLAGFLALLILLGVKARVEERLLEARFDSYRHYARQTGRFVPGIGRLPGTVSGKK